MLASRSQPPTPLSYPRRQQLQYSDLPSPSASTLPLYYTTAFSSSTPSPVEANLNQHRQQYFDLSTSSIAAEATTNSLPLDVFGRSQSMNHSSSVQLQNSPVRVQRTSATPQPATRASESQMSVLTESLIPELPWQSYDESMRSIGHPGMRQSPEQDRKTHQRIPSGSSIGSAGPPSPYSSNVSHPFIAQADGSLSPSGVDSSYYDGLRPSTDSLNLSKSLRATSLSSQDSFLAPAFQNYNPQRQDSESNLEAKMAMLQALKEQHATMEDDSPAPGFATPGRPPSSVDHRSPATPKTVTGEEYEEVPKSIPNSEDSPNLFDAWLEDHSRFAGFRSAVPQLDRTMSDIYQDELYSPVAYGAPTSTENNRSAPNKNNLLLSPYRSVFSERIHAASNGHLQSPTVSPSSRERSPFRQGSPYAPAVNTFDGFPSQSKLGSAAHLKEQQKAEADKHALRQARSAREQPSSTPNTISPRDALLDYHATEEEMKMPLFPSVDAMTQYSSAEPSFSQQSQGGDDEDTATEQSFGSMVTSRRQSSSGFSTGSAPQSGFTFAPPSVPGGIQLPQQYPFIPQRRNPMQRSDSLLDQTPEFPARLTSMESSVSDAPPDSSGEVLKPPRTTADSGTYTCTYHGCTLRFETPAKLQKHKREGHRQVTPGQVGGASEGMTSAALLPNSQAGPHKCERVNPSTGKPCNAIFSRPYDLTRHEDTIHNARKQKVRCHLCTEEKSFSRNDALTRHMRVVHPDVDFGGRSRRRQAVQADFPSR